MVLKGQRGPGTPLHPSPHYYISQSPSHALSHQSDWAKFVRSFIHSSNVLLSTYYVLSAVLDSGDTALNEADKALALERLTCLWGVRE